LIGRDAAITIERAFGLCTLVPISFVGYYGWIYINHSEVRLVHPPDQEGDWTMAG
jgi:hypothetical protein